MFLARTIKMSKPNVNGRLIGPEISGGIRWDWLSGKGRERERLWEWLGKALPPFSTKHSKGSLLPPVFSKRKSLIVSSGDELPS